MVAVLIIVFMIGIFAGLLILVIYLLAQVIKGIYLGMTKTRPELESMLKKQKDDNDFNKMMERL